MSALQCLWRYLEPKLHYLLLTRATPKVHTFHFLHVWEIERSDRFQR
ncbi:hypothetical protein MASSI9I_51238 [Massilia sp. 9I]|nr:hypothetical protein MASSI9I_51238 [Massilia sp. 9I]